MNSWNELTTLTGGKPFIVERIRLEENGIAIEGAFEPPPLAKLSAEDQLFLAAFVRSHGSIKKMEELFGISYPTVKSRLNRIGEEFDFIEVDVEPEETSDSRAGMETGPVLDRLERGEITAEEAIKQIRKGEVS